MASNNNNMFRYLALVLALLLVVVSVAECRSFANGSAESSSISCELIYGFEEGDTCIDIAKEFNLSPEAFLSINPNLNCDKIFVGEWLCVAASA